VESELFGALFSPNPRSLHDPREEHQNTGSREGQREFGFLAYLTCVDISSNLRFHVLGIKCSGDSFVSADLTWVV
jgi:hypothetical protein